MTATFSAAHGVLNIIGDAHAKTIAVSRDAGDDLLIGSDGDDTLSGDDGNDMLNGGAETMS